ncbi:MAG: phage minor head protein, partial [Gammaproteobacteria bacterium]
RFAQLTDPDLLKTRPYWRYHHSESVRFPRPEHQAWNGLVLRHDDPWWQAHFPPNGWGCKCRVYAESERTLKRSGKAGPDSAPPTEFVSRRIGARGPAPRTVSVPKGIDPGWDYTPGRTVAPQVRAQIQARQATLPGPIAEQLGAELKRIPPTPAPPPPPAAVQTLSTVGDFEPDEIAKALAAVPGAADQVAKVGEFLQAHPQKALVIKKAEMGRGKAAQALTPSVATFLGTNEFRAAVTHTHPRPKDVNGWTRSDWEHFVVRAERGDRADDVDPRQLAELVEHVTSRATNGIPEWSMSGALAGLRGGKRAPLATLVHELGHQVHFWAGSPTPPTRASITRYATTNSYEWHAETFVAWLFNRDALMRWSRHAAEHLDNLLASAISNVRKR